MLRIPSVLIIAIGFDVSRYLRTLPDYINKDIEILSVGINPSPLSVQRGYPFAAPRNRFWAALNASHFTGATYTPSVESMVDLLIVERIGFTDLVKRPTAGISELRASDYRIMFSTRCVVPGEDCLHEISALRSKPQ
jgi:mismatch-specific thymine-DNA glycosylase